MTLQFIKLLFFCCLFSIITKENNAAKILGLFPSPSKSHLILGQALLKGLAKAGHEVTMVSPFPLNENVTNYRDIQIRDLRSDMHANADKANGNFLDYFSGNPFHIIRIIYEFGTNIADTALQDDKIQKLLRSNENFDVVISAIFINEVFLSFADHFNTHVIGFSTFGASEWTNDLVGNPSPYSYIPQTFLGFTSHMSFFERLYNTVVAVYNEILYNFIHLPKQEALRQKYLPNTKPLAERLDNVSLILLNSHPTLLSPRPFVPNMIEIAGFHIDSPKPLPSDLQKILDEAKDGVIYFSLGSNIRTKDVDERTKNELVQCLSQLKQTVFWKWDDDSLSSLTKNLVIRQWFPQRDILAHPNVKLFITHGGLLSTIEAISSGMPMIGIPLFADQKLNMKTAQKLGYSLSVDYKNITSDAFCWAINEILSNPKYEEEVKKRSSLFNDRIVKPIDEAVYWVEYVLRHNGASHLKTARNSLKLYQYLLLDIILFILAILFIIILVLYLICKKFLSKMKHFFRNKSRTKDKTH